VHGDDGVTGATGATGADGLHGTVGKDGANGARGTQGATGTTGAQGAQGVQGTQGATGQTGAQGAQGVQGIEGEQGPQGLAATTESPTPAPTPIMWGSTAALAGASCADLHAKGVTASGSYFVQGAPLYDHKSIALTAGGFDGSYAGIDNVNSYAGEILPSGHPLVGKSLGGVDIFLKRDKGATGTVALVVLKADKSVKATIGTVDVATLGETSPGGVDDRTDGTTAWTLTKFRPSAPIALGAGEMIALKDGGGLSYYANHRVYYPEVKNMDGGFDKSGSILVKHWSSWYPEPMSDLKMTVWGPNVDSAYQTFCDSA